MNEKVLYIVFYSANNSFIKLLPILNSYLFTNQKNVLISHIFNQKLFFLVFFQKKNNHISNSTMDMDNYYSSLKKDKNTTSLISMISSSKL